MSTLQIDGVVPIIPTPFLPQGGPDWNSLKRLLDFAVQGGVCAVCLPAYASEFYKLTDVERRDMVIHAVELMQGRLPVIGQVNHVSSAYVAETAKDLERAGAAAISVAVPRMFGLPERDLLRYYDRILKAITIPLLIQDFNPGGPTLSLGFLQQLRSAHAHFRFLKLEEPLMSDRVRLAWRFRIFCSRSGAAPARGIRMERTRILLRCCRKLPIACKAWSSSIMRKRRCWSRGE
jgi:4-hydroxy-tetrahydrodipicolinate synthase